MNTTSSYFWGRKINLSGISLAKRSRSGPNSVYMDVSRGDNVQRISGRIGPFWAKWGLGRVPHSRSFFVEFSYGPITNQKYFSATSQRPIFTKFGHETFGVPSPNPETFWKIFTLGVVCPQNLKSKIGQTGTSRRAGCRSRDALFTPRCSTRAREFRRSRQRFSTTYGCGATGRQSCPVFGFWPIFPIPSGDQPTTAQGLQLTSQHDSDFSVW